MFSIGIFMRDATNPRDQAVFLSGHAPSPCSPGVSSAVSWPCFGIFNSFLGTLSESVEQLVSPDDIKELHRVHSVRTEMLETSLAVRCLRPFGGRVGRRSLSGHGSLPRFFHWLLGWSGVSLGGFIRCTIELNWSL